MLKVLEVFTYSKSVIGGISIMIDSYMEGVAEFADNDCCLELLNVAPSINLGHSALNNLAYIFTQRKAVTRHLNEHHYDVVHIHTSREFLFLKDVLLAKMINKKFHIPVVMTIHVGAMETVFNRIGWFKQKAISIMNKYIRKSIFLSKTIQDEFFASGLSSDRGTVLYNFHNLAPAECLPKSDSTPLQLLFVGRIERDKGIVELLTALSELSELDFHLNICGKLADKSIEDEVNKLKAKLGDKVSFLGYVVGVDKTKLFHNSDMLLLPSYHEGLPIVIMEALAAGCAIMSTRVGAIPEVLGDENCYWIDVKSTDSIKNKLSNIRSIDLSMVKKVNAELGHKYAFNKHVQKLTDIYKNVTEK